MKGIAAPHVAFTLRLSTDDLALQTKGSRLLEAAEQWSAEDGGGLAAVGEAWGRGGGGLSLDHSGVVNEVKMLLLKRERGRAKAAAVLSFMYCFNRIFHEQQVERAVVDTEAIQGILTCDIVLLWKACVHFARSKSMVFNYYLNLNYEPQSACVSGGMPGCTGV